MIKRTAILMTTAFMFVTLPGAAVAGDQDQDRVQTKIKDGSCLVPDYSTDMSGVFTLAADRIRDCDGDKDQDKDQARDGSCLDYSTNLSGSFTLAGDNGNGEGDRDRLQDPDSCLDGGYSTNLSGSFTLAADRIRDCDGDKDQDKDQARDGSCLDYSTDLSGSFTLAGDNGNGEGDRDRLQDPDSCLDGGYSTDLSGSFTLAADKIRDCDGDKDQDKDQARDGSCLDYSTDSVNMILAGRQRDKDNTKDKLKDCKGNA
jgi:hypothetical protein